jgi:hypothetical protein
MVQKNEYFNLLFTALHFDSSCITESGLTNVQRASLFGHQHRMESQQQHPLGSLPGSSSLPQDTL